MDAALGGAGVVQGLVRTDLEQLPDEQLVVFSQGGHERAFALLFERHRERFQTCLSRHLYPRVLRRWEAGEVLQDALLTAFERLDEFTDTGAGSFATWVDQIVMSKITETVQAYLAARRQARSPRRPSVC
jgi:DNA-directed RNA polymerase specialized sigma24 family protein